MCVGGGGGITNNTHWFRKAKRYLITIMMGPGNVASSFVCVGVGGA